MATKTITTKVDDIDGSVAENSFTFTWQGYKYHIDLSAAHSAEMKDDFEKWVSAARRDRGNVRQPRAPRGTRAAKAAAPETTEPAPKAPRATKATKAAKPKATRRGRGAAKAKKASGPSAADIRAWAAQRGIQVASRGRIAPALVEQYLAATAA